MRSLSAVALCAAVALAGLGCQESGFDENKETVRPLKVQHVLGETKVPGQAEEPLTLTIDTLDDTLALGVRPARAAVPDARLPAYLRGQGRVSLMRPVGAGDLAAAEAVHADLILGSSSQAGLYEKLSRIAPTVITEGGGGQWKLNVRLVGEALGRTNAAEQVLIDYDGEAARALRAIRAAGAGSGAAKPRVAVVRVTANGLRYAKEDSFAGTILADAGVKQVTRNAPRAQVDVMLLSEGPGARAHVDGRFVRVDDELWWGPGGALAGRAALAQLQRAVGG